MCLFQRNRGLSLVECSSRHTQGRPSHGGIVSSVSTGTDGSRWAPTLTLAEKTDTLEQRLGHTRCEAAACLGPTQAVTEREMGVGVHSPSPGDTQRDAQKHMDVRPQTHTAAQPPPLRPRHKVQAPCHIPTQHSSVKER